MQFLQFYWSQFSCFVPCTKVYGKFFVSKDSLQLLYALVISFLHCFRKRFPAKANCWFCNYNDRVPYEFRNCFICAGCGQYNGFSIDGGYNREIPEQHYTNLNPITNCVFSEENVYALKKNNGLCFGCNRNQELKILQLASFVPDDEDNFDNEVEEYRRSLEKSYKLCERCERTVKRSLNQIKSRIVGAKIGDKSQMKTVRPVTGQFRRERAIRLLTYLSILTTTVVLYKKVMQIRITINQLAQITGQNGAELIFRCVAYLLAIGSLLMHYIVENPVTEAAQIYVSTVWDAFTVTFTPTDTLDHDFYEIVNIIGIITGVLLIIFYEGRNLKPLITLVSVWSFNTLMHNHEYLTGNIDLPWVKVGESVICLMATLAAIHLLSVPSTRMNCSSDMNQSFHKICTEEAEDVSDNESDLSLSVSLHRSANGTTAHLLNSTLKSVDLNESGASYFSKAASVNHSFQRSPSVISNNKMLGNESIYSLNPTVNPFQRNPFYNHLNLDRQTPSELSSCYRLRNNIIQPPKLNRDFNSPDSSWVAGGFFTTSPKKAATPNTDFVPIHSRTSSQSSGFESSAPFSREPSIAKDFQIFNSRNSALSEPIPAIYPLRPQPIYPGDQQSHSPQGFFAKPSPINPLLRHSVMHQSNLSLASSRSNSNLSRLDNRSKIFGSCDQDSRLYPFNNKLTDTSFSQQQAWPSNRSSLPRGSIFNFKKFSQDLSTL